MKQVIFILSFVFATFNLYAQIQTTAKIKFTVNNRSKNETYTVKEGDSVTIYGYKKKSDIHYIAFSTKDIADVSSFRSIFFDVDAKQLKKLPNALSPEIKSLIAEKNNEIISEQYKIRKLQALDGNVSFIYNQKTDFFKTQNTYGEIFKGDTIHILGYSRIGNNHNFALYTNSSYGVFYVVSYDIPFKEQINTQYLPSVDDTDVKITLKQIANNFKQREEEAGKKYYVDALNGKIKAELKSTLLYDSDSNNCPFRNGEYVTVVGYSNVDNKHYFALYSPNGSGIYNSSYYNIFKENNNIRLKYLPPATSDEVTTIIARQKAIVDSLNAIKRDSLMRVLKETTESIIQLYKEFSPVLITDITWSSNSVGGIEVDLSVINCSLETIKYITFQGYFTNAVGDKCHNEIGGGTIWKAKGVGPIGPRPTSFEDYEERYGKNEGSYDFDNLTFYSRTADSFHMSSVTIQYMSGKTITLSGQNLKKHIRYKYPN